MTTWFTADLHFGHEKILDFTERGEFWDDVGQMDEGLVAQWNSLVEPEDEVWVLGDYALGDRARGLSYLSYLSGTKYLVAGNHDRCLPGVNNNAHRYVREYLDAGFEAVFQWAQVKLPPLTRKGPGMKVMLSHFPYDGDHTEGERFSEYRLRDRGIPLVHGHVHESYRGRLSNAGTPTLNVGVDVWNYGPVAAFEVHERLAALRAARA
jgi:calcineurin-like phosphoesterase family protein